MFRTLPSDVREHIDPLAERHFINHYGHMSHEHNIKVVTTRYEVGSTFGGGLAGLWGRGEEIMGYQMAVSNHQYDSEPNVPEAKFSYDLSPTAVVISQKGRRWYEFATSLCAIIGGMFTTFQLLNGVLGSVGKKVGGNQQRDILSPQGASRRG